MTTKGTGRARIRAGSNRVGDQLRLPLESGDFLPHSRGTLHQMASLDVYIHRLPPWAQPLAKQLQAFAEEYDLLTKLPFILLGLTALLAVAIPYAVAAFTGGGKRRVALDPDKKASYRGRPPRVVSVLELSGRCQSFCRYLVVEKNLWVC